MYCDIMSSLGQDYFCQNETQSNFSILFLACLVASSAGSAGAYLQCIWDEGSEYTLV